MKRIKRMLILLAVLVVVCAVTLVVTHIQEKKEEIKTSGETVLSIDPETVTALSWSYDDTSLAFTKDDDGNWAWDDDADFPVDADHITELLNVFQEFGAAFTIENADDLSQYGLDDPTATITLTTEDKTYEIKLGSYSTMDSERYVSIGDDNVYLAAVDPMDSYQVEISNLIKNDTTPASLSQVSEMTVSGEYDYTMTADEDNADSLSADDKYFTTEDGQTLALDTTLVDNYFSAISSLSLSDYVTYNATDEELADYGLDQPELSIHLAYTGTDEDGNESDQTFDLHIGRNQEELAAALEADDSEADALNGENSAADESADALESGDTESDDEESTVTSYVRIGDSPIIYQITDAEYKALAAASVNDLRHQEVLTADFNTITEIDFTLEGKTYQLLSSPSDDDDDSRIFSYDDKDIDITDLQTALTALTVNDFTDAETAGKEEIDLTLYLDNEAHSEVHITLYRLDGEDCLVELDGEMLGKVSRSQVVDLIEAANAIVL